MKVGGCKEGDWPEVGYGGCCYGSAIYGPKRCTCWTPVYDVEQAEPRPAEPAGCKPTMCGTCAYRPGSPERRGYEKAAADADDLDALVRAGQPFWCHEGMRAPVAWFHPPTLSWVFNEDDLAFSPPVRTVDGKPVPFQASGAPADLCGGWAARRLSLLQRDVSRRRAEPRPGSTARPPSGRRRSPTPT